MKNRMRWIADLATSVFEWREETTFGTAERINLRINISNFYSDFPILVTDFKEKPRPDLSNCCDLKRADHQSSKRLSSETRMFSFSPKNLNLALHITTFV